MRFITSRIFTKTRCFYHNKIIARSVGVKAPIVDNIVGCPTPDTPYERGNIVHNVFKDINKWSNYTAVECSDTKRIISFGQLQTQSSRWSGFLQKIGLKPGDILAVVSPNHPLYPTIFMGTIGIGAIVSPANPAYTEDELVVFLDDCKPKIVVSSLQTEQTVRSAMNQLKTTAKLVTLGPGTGNSINIDQVLEDKNIPLVDPIELSGEEAMVLPYSSGTTGKPKGTAVSHNAMSNFLCGYLHPDYYNGRPTLSESDREAFMMMLPVFHVAGMIAVLFPAVKTGVKLVCVSKFNPSTFIDIVTSNNIGFLHMVPTILNFLVNHPSCNSESMSHVHTALCGAAPVPLSAAMKLKEKIGNDIIFQEIFGMTEVLAAFMVPRKGEQLGWAGPPLVNVKAKAIDITTGDSLPPMTDGEICIKSPSNMLYYLNNPKATADTLIDGWVHTGDVGHYDENGYFQIVDRTKELIKVKGFQVSPSELEDILRRLPAVLDVGVVGVPDERLGEAPRAVIVVKEGHKLTEDEVHHFINPKVASHKRLVGGVKFVPDLPKTGSGKVMRRFLKDL